MNGQTRGGVGVRLFVAGGAEAKRDFREFRDEGKRAFSEIAAGARGANPALLAVSRGVGEVRGGVADLAERTGAGGRVLSSFGVAGIGAAAALGGLAIAVHQAKAALAFADEIGDSAAKLDLGTDALQEYRYAIRQVGGEAKDADTAIKGFTTAIGTAASGLSPRAMKPFAALGFDKADLQLMKQDVPAALELVADRIAGLSSEAERSAVAEKLGLTPLLPLLREGAQGIADLRAEAADLGIVMDDQLVAKAGEAHDKLETLSQVIDVQLKSAFVDLAPYIVGATAAVADLARELGDLAGDRKLRGELEGLASIVAGFASGGVVGGLRAVNAAQARSARDRGYEYLPEDFGMDPDDPAAIRAAARARAMAGGGSAGASLTPPAGRAKAKAKPKLNGTPISDGDLFRSWDPATGELTKQRSPQDWAFKESLGFFPGDEPKKAKIDLEIDLEDNLYDQVRPQLDEMRYAVEDTFAEGARAAFSGDFVDWLKYRLSEAAFVGLGEGAGELFSKLAAGQPGGGSGLFSTLATIGSSLFRRGAGGSNRAGDRVSTAEYGEELGVFGRDGRVFSHEETVRMLQEAAGGGESRSTGPRAVTVHFNPVIHAQGAGPREIDQLRGELARMKNDLPGVIVNTVNDGLDRRAIRQG